jgi:hypothetical protein
MFFSYRFGTAVYDILHMSGPMRAANEAHMNLSKVVLQS